MGRAHPLHLLAGQHALHDLGAQRSVLLDHLVLVERQLPGLEQDGVGHPDLAHVVDQRGALQQIDPLGAPAADQGQSASQRRHPLGVLTGQRILGVDGPGQGLQPGQSMRAFDLGHPPLVSRHRHDLRVVDPTHVAPVALAPGERGVGHPVQRALAACGLQAADSGRERHRGEVGQRSAGHLLARPVQHHEGRALVGLRQE